MLSNDRTVRLVNCLEKSVIIPKKEDIKTDDQVFGSPETIRDLIGI
jgi:hypothetical protein